MVAFKHVLVPVDFAECSRRAVDAVGALLDHTEGKVTLVHVIDFKVSFTVDPPPEVMRELDARATRFLDRWAAELAAALEVPVATRITVGGPGTQIVRVLEGDPTFDLVIVGSHGRAGLRRVVLGSVAEMVVRHARCPVFVARARPPVAAGGEPADA